MKQWKWLSASLLLVILIMAGCGKEKYPPVVINEEVDRCEICNMAIKDDAYATQIITKEGRSLKFDDLGCLNQWRVENGTEQIAATYVRDYNSLEWVKYDKAYYVYDASISTPMAYGILSFENEDDAQNYIQEHGVGELFTAEKLATHSWAVNKENMGSHAHDEGHSHEHELDMDTDTNSDVEAHNEELGHEAGADSLNDVSKSHSETSL